jgi:uncharacterized protein (TIGR02266 family)
MIMRPEALADADAPAQSGLTPSAPQRRANPRISVDLDVSLGTDQNFYAGFAENLSASGVFVATHRLRAIGENLEICIHLPNGSEIRGIGQVRWVRLYDETSATPPGMGVHFLELEPDAMQAIERFLARRDPMLYDGG